MQKCSPTRWSLNFLNLYWMIKPEIMVSPKDHSITLQEEKKKGSFCNFYIYRLETEKVGVEIEGEHRSI